MSSDHWAAARLSDIAEVRLGRQRSPKRSSGPNMYPYMRAANVTWKGISLHDVKEMDFTRSEFGTYALRHGDLLLAEASGSASEVGKPAVWAGQVRDCCFQNTLIRVRAPGDIVPFLHLHFQKDAVTGAFAQASRGVGIHHLGAKALTEWNVQVPPLAEQHRIVSAIESYFTRLDDAVATLERVQRNLKRYRASVLKAAVEGRLMPTEAELARAEGRTYEPASVLLTRILAERRRRWEEAELAKMKAKGKAPTDDTWKAKYVEPVAPDTSELPELPEGWCWASIDQLSHLVRNGYSKKPSAKGDVRILRISAVRPMSVDFSDSRWLAGDPVDYASDLVEDGDLLFTRYNGSPALVGVAGLVRTVDRPTVHPDKLIKVRFLEGGASVRYLELAANSGASRRFVEGRTRTTAGQAGISGSDVRQIPIPLPPCAEQVRIYTEADRHQSVADDSLAALRAGSSRLARLRQSILKWAFEGRLVDQAPTDEPASVLLERIRAEREATHSEPARTVRKTRSKKAGS